MSRVSPVSPIHKIEAAQDSTARTTKDSPQKPEAPAYDRKQFKFIEREKDFFTDLQTMAEDAAEKITAGNSHHDENTQVFKQYLIDLARKIKEKADDARRKNELEEIKKWVQLGERIALHEEDLKKFLTALKEKKEAQAALEEATQNSQKITAAAQGQNNNQERTSAASYRSDIAILNFLLAILAIKVKK